MVVRVVCTAGDGVGACHTRTRRVLGMLGLGVSVCTSLSAPGMGASHPCTHAPRFFVVPLRYGVAGSTVSTCTGLCTAGYVCPPGSTNATAVVCPAGTYSAAGAGVCTNCSAGKFGNVTGQYCPPMSAAGIVCPPGSYRWVPRSVAAVHISVCAVPVTLTRPPHAHPIVAWVQHGWGGQLYPVSERRIRWHRQPDDVRVLGSVPSWIILQWYG